MSISEAEEMAEKVAGLYSGVTRHTLEWFVRQFEPYGAGVVDAAVSRYRRFCSSLDPTHLMNFVRDEHWRRIRPTSDSRVEKQAADLSFRRVRDAVHALSRTQFDRHLKAVYSENPFLQKCVGGRDPRDVKLVQAKIVERLAAE